LCWLHAERHLRQIISVTDEQHRWVDLQRQLVWWFYADLKAYKDEPSPQRRTALRQRFDRVFGRVTGFAELDEAVARILANKDDLLRVLDRPEIPLNTNTSETDVRSFVTKRKISGETRSTAGKRYLPQPAENLRQARHLVLGLPGRAAQNPRRWPRALAA
jgi:hypothetical protein